MSYDIHLKDSVIGNTAKVLKHLMIGGTCKAYYHPKTGMFTPAMVFNSYFSSMFFVDMGNHYTKGEFKGIKLIGIVFRL